MAMLKFNYGKYENLVNKAYSDGNVYVTTDEKAMYVDVDNQRIRLGQIIYTTSSAVKPPYSEESFYYFSDLNALVTWGVVDAAQGTKGWIQINSTQALASRLDTLERWKTTASEQIANLQAKDTNFETRIGELEALKPAEAGAQVNVIEKVTIPNAEGTATEVAITNKTVALGKFAAADKSTISKSDLDSEFTTYLSNSDQKFADIEATLEVLTGGETGGGTIATQISNAINSFKETELDPVIEDVGENAEAIEAIEQKIGSDALAETAGTTIVGAINKLSGIAGTHTQQIATLTEKSATKEELTNAVNGINGSIEGINGNIETINGNISDINGNITALENIVGTGLENNVTLTDKVTALDSTLADLEARVDSTTNIMNFRGVSQKTLADGFSDIITEQNPAALGDVIIAGEKEYVYVGVSETYPQGWAEYGDATGNAGAIDALDDRVTDVENALSTLNGQLNGAEGLAKKVANHEERITTIETTHYTAAKVDALLAWGTF